MPPQVKPATNDGRMHVTAGDVLFQQGDPGGDLYFIERGIVEIYTRKDGEEVILSEMRQGEIIGVMTCLNNDKRMASARAKTPVTCKKVPHLSIAKVLKALPNWLNIVLKEFSLRLAQMNKSYSDAMVRMRRLEETQISALYSGLQLASAIAHLGEFLAIQIDDAKFIVIETLLERLQLVLNFTKEDVERLFKVLQDAGLLRTEIEPDKKRRVIRLEQATKLSHFVQFVREAQHGPARKLLRAKLSYKEIRVLATIVKFAARLGMDLEKTGQLAIADLERNMEKAMGVRFEREALDKGVELKLLALKKEGEQTLVSLRPAQLGRTIACIETVRKLTTLNEETTLAVKNVS